MPVQSEAKEIVGTWNLRAYSDHSSLIFGFRLEGESCSSIAWMACRADAPVSFDLRLAGRVE